MNVDEKETNQTIKYKYLKMISTRYVYLKLLILLKNCWPMPIGQLSVLTCMT